MRAMPGKIPLNVCTQIGGRGHYKATALEREKHFPTFSILLGNSSRKVIVSLFLSLLLTVSTSKGSRVIL
jgi:hypothetical protein